MAYLLSIAVTSMAGRGGVLTMVGTVLGFVASGAALAEAPRRHGPPLWACLPNPLSGAAQLHIVCVTGVHDIRVSCGLINKSAFQKVLFIKQWLSIRILSA